MKDFEESKLRMQMEKKQIILFEIAITFQVTEKTHEWKILTLKSLLPVSPV